MIEQMTIDGGMSPVESAKKLAPLSPAQKAILWRARDNGGTIRAVEAGTLVHAGRTPAGCNKYAGSYGGEGCCHYAASDGTDACKRLVKRGLLLRGDGVYEVVA